MKRIVGFLVSLTLIMGYCNVYAGETITDEINGYTEMQGDIINDIKIKDVIVLNEEDYPDFGKDGISLCSDDMCETAFRFMYDKIKEGMTDENASGRTLIINLPDNGIELTVDGEIKDGDLVIHNDENLSKVTSRLAYECGELLIEKHWDYNVVYSPRRPNKFYIGEIAVTYISDRNKLEGMLREIDDVVNEFTESVPEGLSDVEKTLLVHDFIANKTVYGDSLGEGVAHSMYGTLVAGESVCQGYAEAMCYILNKMGVECVSCVCDDINHVWNCVNIDNKWYHVDITWDDYNKSYISDGNGGAIEKEFDYILYDNFLTGLDFVINEKLPSKHSVYYEGCLKYPSGKLSDSDAQNYEFTTGYVFNGLKCAFFYSGDDLCIIAPIGFYYENGKLISKTASDHFLLAPEYTFEYGGVKAMDYSVSKPELVNGLSGDGQYTFLYQGTEYGVNKSNTALIMSADNGIKNVALTAYLNVSNYSAKIAQRDKNTIDNAVGAKFFMWGNHLYPYSYVITK